MNERKLTKSELAKREDIIMKMKKNKRALTQKYGKDAEAVMYGRATKLAKKQAEAMDQDRIKEMVKAALMNPVKEDQVEEGNAFIVAADAARDAGKKEFEFPKGSGKMHPVTVKADIDEVDNSEYAMAVRAAKAYKPGPKPAPKRHPKPKNARDLERYSDEEVFYMRDELLKRRAQLMRDMEQEAELEGGPIADRYGKELEKIDSMLAYISEDTLEEEFDLDVKGGTEPDKDADVAGILGAEDVLGLEEGASTEEKRIAMRAIKSIAKYRGVSNDEARNDLVRAAREIGELKEGQLNENKEEALMELRNILDELQVLGDQAREIIAMNFPSYLSQGEAYGAFDMGSSSNRYDTTLASIVADIEEYGEEEDEDMMQEDLDLGHQDNEPHMLKADLYRIGKYAMELYQMVDQFEGQGEVDFPHWWQSKVIKAKDMLVSAKHYLDFEVNEPQIDAMVDVAAEEEVINEAKSLKDLVNSVSKKGNLNDVIARAKDMAKEEGLDFSDEEIERAVENSFDRMMGLGENARDKAAMAFDKMKVGTTIKTSKGEFKKVDDKHFEMVKKPGRKFTVKQMTFIKEENLNEGVWSLGSVNDIKAAIQTMEMGLDMDDSELEQHLQDNDSYFYNVLGDDLLHDSLGKAYDLSAMGNEDRAHNELSDAIGRAYDLLKFAQKREGVKEGLPKGYWDKKMDAKDEVSEDYDALVNKIKKQGKSEKAAKAIAGAVASYKAKGGGKGPTAKQKARG